MKSPINGGVWTKKSGDSYHVTGTDRDGRRFKLVFNNWFQAKCINVGQGSK